MMKSYRDLGFDDNFSPQEKKKREFISGVNSDTFLEGVDAGLLFTHGRVTSQRSGWQLGFDEETGQAQYRGVLKTGTLVSGKVIVGDNNVSIDGNNKRILINDGTTNRILLGEQENGF